MKNNNVLKVRELHNRGINSDSLDFLRFKVFSDVKNSSLRLLLENPDALRELVVTIDCNEIHFKLPEHFSRFADFLSDFYFDVECNILVVDFDRCIGQEIDVPLLNVFDYE